MLRQHPLPNPLLCILISSLSRVRHKHTHTLRSIPYCCPTCIEILSLAIVDENIPSVLPSLCTTNDSCDLPLAEGEQAASATSHSPPPMSNFILLARSQDGIWDRGVDRTKMREAFHRFYRDSKSLFPIEANTRLATYTPDYILFLFSFRRRRDLPHAGRGRWRILMLFGAAVGSWVGESRAGATVPGKPSASCPRTGNKHESGCFDIEEQHSQTSSRESWDWKDSGFLTRRKKHPSILFLIFCQRVNQTLSRAKMRGERANQRDIF